VLTIADALVCGVLLTWFFLSVVGQLDSSRTLGRRLRWVRRWDYLNLIPIWTFFAPKPGWTDYYLMYRDRLPGGAVTPWTEVPLLGSRRWWHAIWNPGKHEKKALLDTVKFLFRTLGSDKHVMNELRKRPNRKARLRRIPSRLAIATPYLVILNVVSGLERLDAAQTQFLIMHREAGKGEPRLLFASDWHKLDSEGGASFRSSEPL
jgi:hypothetical protein